MTRSESGFIEHMFDMGRDRALGDGQLPPIFSIAQLLHQQIRLDYTRGRLAASLAAGRSPATHVSNEVRINGPIGAVLDLVTTAR